METDNSISLAITVLIIGIVAAIGATILINYQEAVAEDASSSTSLEFIYDTPETLPISGINSELSSASAEVYNNSWQYFDGNNDFIEIDYTVLSTENLTRSTSLWVKPADFVNPSGGAGYFTEWDGNQNPRNSLQCNSGNCSSISIAYANSTGYNKGGNYVNLNTEQWNHILAIWDTNATHINGQIYVNGINLENVTWVNEGFRTSNTIYLGAQKYSFNRFFKGGMDEVRVYNTTLTDSQITEIYNSGREANASLPSDGLVLWYSFDEASGTTVYDKSGNGNNGE